MLPEIDAQFLRPVSAGLLGPIVAMYCALAFLPMVASNPVGFTMWLLFALLGDWFGIERMKGLISLALNRELVDWLSILVAVAGMLTLSSVLDGLRRK